MSDIQGLSQLATQGVLGVDENVQGNVYKAVATPFGQLDVQFVDAAAGSNPAVSPGWCMAAS